MLLAFSATPIGSGSDSVSSEVAEAIRIVRESGLPNRTDPMFTTIEGEWDDVMAVVKQAVMAVAERSERVSVVMKIDYRPGAEDALESKLASLERRLEA